MAEVNRNRRIYELWTNIQDIIGPANVWPFLIRRLFWTRNVKHFNRILLAAFVYVNGLNPDIFLEWVQINQLARDRAAYNHFCALFRLFERGHYGASLYGWNVSNGRYEYLNGTIRLYQPKWKR